MHRVKHYIDRYLSIPVPVRASFWFLVCTVLQRGMTVITTPLFTRLLSTYEYGVYSVFTSWLGIFSCFLTLNLFSGVYPQLVVKNESSREDITLQLISMTTVLTIFGSAVFMSMSRMFGVDIGLKPQYLICMFIAIWADAVFGFWSYAQRLDYKYKALALVTLMQSISYPLSCIYLIRLFSDRLTGLFVGYALSRFLCYGPIVLIQIRKTRNFYDCGLWLHSMRLGIGLIPHYLSSIVLSSSDRIMIERFIDSGAAGFYNLAYTISMAGLLINQAILQTLNPWLLRKIKAKEFSSMDDMSTLLLTVVAMLNLMVLLFAPELVNLFAPSSYSDSIVAMPPIVMSVFFMFCYNFFSVFEFYYEKTSYISLATTFGAVINVVLNLVLIPRFGYVAAGYTTLVCYVLFSVAHYSFMRVICKNELEDVRVFNPVRLCAISAVFVCLGFVTPTLYSFPMVKYLLFAAIGILLCLNRDKLKTMIVKLRS